MKVDGYKWTNEDMSIDEWCVVGPIRDIRCRISL